MKHIQKYSDFDKVNEDMTGLMLTMLAIQNMNSTSTSTYMDPKSYESPYKTLDRKHVSTAQDDIEVPWYNFRDKSKQEFLDMEKSIRPKVLSERQRLAEETLEFDINTIVYDFMKNPNLDEVAQKEIDTLNMRMGQMHINTLKKENLISKEAKIYLNEIKKIYSKVFSEYANKKDDSDVSHWGSKEKYGDSIAWNFELNIFDRIKNILRGTSADPRSPEKIDIEIYKPVKPTPIDPKLLKRIEEYEKGLKKLDQEIDDKKTNKKNKNLEDLSEKEQLKENDVKAINDFVNKYFKKESARVLDENKEEIEKINTRLLKPGISLDKKMGLCYRILKFYWINLKKNNDLDSFFNSVENLTYPESKEITIGSLYYKLELNKLMGIDSGSVEEQTKYLQRFLKISYINLGQIR